LLLQAESSSAIYKQIVEQIRSQIVDGKLAPGDSLPTVRSLASELEVSALTVFRAYGELRDMGLLETRARQGVLVANRIGPSVGSAIMARLPVQGPMASYEQLSRSTGIRSMASSVGDPALFFADQFVAEVQRFRDQDPWNFYLAEPEGVPELIQQIAAILSRQGLAASEATLVVTSGSLQGLSVLFDAIASPGDVVLVQEPGRIWLKELLSLKRLVGVPVRLAGSGIDLDHVRYCFKQFRPKALLVSPDFGHCTGLRMTLAERERCLSLARELGILIIEDAACSAIGLGISSLSPIRSLDTSAVAYVGSFSYSLCPGLGVGYLSLPPALKLPVKSVTAASGASTPKFLQLALAGYVRSGFYDAHLKRVIPRYAARRDGLVASLKQFMPTTVAWTASQGGFSTWLTLGENVSSSELYDKALKRGIAFAPGALFLTTASPESQLRLSFGMLEPEALREAVKALASLL